MVLHFNIFSGRTATGLLACIKQAPTRVKLDVDVELRTVFPELIVGAVDSNDIADVIDEGAVFDAFGVHDGGRVLEVHIGLVADRVHSRVNQLQCSHELLSRGLHGH